MRREVKKVSSDEWEFEIIEWDFLEIPVTENHSLGQPLKSQFISWEGAKLQSFLQHADPPLSLLLDQAVCNGRAAISWVDLQVISLSSNVNLQHRECTVAPGMSLLWRPEESVYLKDCGKHELCLWYHSPWLSSLNILQHQKMFLH